jgi:hypothetical protein
MNPRVYMWSFSALCGVAVAGLAGQFVGGVIDTITAALAAAGR